MGFDLYEEILSALERCKAKVNEIRQEGELKGKLEYT